MIEIEDKDAIELYNKLKQFILNSKDYEYSEQNGKEEGKVTFINKKGDKITVKIYHWKHSKSYGAHINRVTDKYGAFTEWELKQDSRAVQYGYGWDYDDYYEVTSREIPENILKPFIKKKHRPKKGTHKTYVEKEIDDNRTLIDEITKLYKKYKNATEKKESTQLEKEDRIKKAIEEITLQYKEKLEKRSLEVKNIQKKLEEYDNLVAKYSTLDIDSIGEAIAKIISSLSDKEFIYEQVIDEYIVTGHDFMGDTIEYNINDRDNVIIDSSKYQKHYYDPDVLEHGQVDELVKNGDAICLSKNVWGKDKNITFLTSKDGVISFNINLDNFSYIKDFIMELVQYRFQRRLDRFNKDDIEFYTKKFIEKSEEIKIQNRIIVLKKELDTLNSKLKEKV